MYDRERMCVRGVMGCAREGAIRICERVCGSVVIVV